MLRRTRLGLLAAAVLAVPTAAQADVHMNEVQAFGTHNSYHRETSQREQATYDQLIKTPGDYAAYLAYGHASIPKQLARQDVRGLELDLFPDRAGGLYAQPLVRRTLGLGPLPDPAWRAPGTKVFHISDFDYRTTCVQLTACLRQVRDWSRAHPGHTPLPIMLELKGSDARAVALGGVQAPTWADRKQLDTLDAEIRSVFGPDDLVTPDDVRRKGLTLQESVTRRGWPSLRQARGKVFFLMDNDPGPIRDAYTAGRPDLQGRVLFTNSRPGLRDAAFVKRNDPLGANGAQIRDLVRRGYYVRTRSDIPLETVLSGSTAMYDAALASGAQLISTDFPRAGMAARYDSDYEAALPEGVPVRCHPLLAPRSCRNDRLER